MPRTHPPYPPEFKRQMLELVRAGRTPHELSREFGSWEFKKNVTYWAGVHFERNVKAIKTKWNISVLVTGPTASPAGCAHELRGGGRRWSGGAELEQPEQRHHHEVSVSSRPRTGVEGYSGQRCWHDGLHGDGSDQWDPIRLPGACGEPSAGGNGVASASAQATPVSRCDFNNDGAVDQADTDLFTAALKF